MAKTILGTTGVYRYAEADVGAGGALIGAQRNAIVIDVTLDGFLISVKPLPEDGFEFERTIAITDKQIGPDAPGCFVTR